MARTNQTYAWGKGGNLVSLKSKKLFSCFIIFFLIFTFSLQPVSFARHSGGGKMAKFNVGKWAAGTAIGLGSFAIGSAVSAGITSGTQGFSNSLTNLSSLSTWANNYNTMVALTQVGRAVGTMGQHYGWDPKATLFASSLVQGIAGGGINPAGYGVSGTLNGMAIGGINGTVSGGVSAALANSKGELAPWAGMISGLAGGFASGFVISGFSVGDGMTMRQNSISGQLNIQSKGSFSFGNKFNFGNALGGAVQGTISSIPSRLVSMGVGSITKNMDDPQDSYIVRQAFSGVYPVVNAAITTPLLLNNRRK